MEERIERINKIVEHFGITKNLLAKNSGVASSNISKMMSGEQPISDKTLGKIVEAYPEINLQWLKTGEGEMIINNSNMQQNNNSGTAMMANSSHHLNQTISSERNFDDFIAGLKAQNVITERSMDQTDKALSEISEQRKLMERLISMLEKK